MTSSPEPGDGAAPVTSPAEGQGADPSASEAKPGNSGRSFWKEFPLLIIVALVIALVIKTFVVQAFFIPSGSMQNTLKIGDKVLVNKLVYHVRAIRPGDIVVFDGAGSWDAPAAASSSSNPVVRVYDATVLRLAHAIGGLFGTAPGQTDYIKRVIGVPGDRVACCNDRGRVTVNGVALHESGYLYPGNVPGDAPLNESGHFSITVPPGHLWVLGDHRAISDDSRGHVDDPGDGTVPENMVIGRAFMIVWPPSRWQILRIPATFDQKGIDGPVAGLAGRALGSPAAPLAGGLAGALPLTLLRRRLARRRNRPGGRRARRRLPRGHRGPGRPARGRLAGGRLARRRADRDRLSRLR
ncbi:MAG TPA: signal peptidase I [Streptosporangiaceae bacterium]|nr:signal peptidase I [Streptosporangiaceae bacterium]